VVLQRTLDEVADSALMPQTGVGSGKASSETDDQSESATFTPSTVMKAPFHARIANALLATARRDSLKRR